MGSRIPQPIKTKSRQDETQQHDSPPKVFNPIPKTIQISNLKDNVWNAEKIPLFIN